MILRELLRSLYFFWTFQSTIHINNFMSFTTGHGWRPVPKTLLLLLNKIKLNYLSVRSDEETNIPTSVITFPSCISLLRLFEPVSASLVHHLEHCADSLKRLSCMQLDPKIMASPSILNLPLYAWLVLFWFSIAELPPTPFLFLSLSDPASIH